MDRDETKERLHHLLAPWGQEHVLRSWAGLDAAGRERLAAQIRAQDWARLDRWIRTTVLARPETAVAGTIAPAPYYPLTPTDAAQAELYGQARERGLALLRAGAVAAFTVAGGQGTRLGYDAPKGTFPISPLTGKSLFQIFAERLLRAAEKYGRPIPWYIMTSPGNDADTRAFLADNAYFGLDPARVRCFPQGMLPAVGFDGKVLLGAPDSLALSPNGHGGSLAALRDSGALADMAARGIEHISYWQVDNPLVHAFDPLFIGLHDLLDADMSNRALIKTGPFEKLGNFCLVDGTLTIIEYSDMPEALATSVDTAGMMRFRAGSPAVHILRRRFVERLTEEGGVELPVHRAEKKVPFVDEHGRLVSPTAPNAVKLEMFIFDALPLARHPLILEMSRTEQFGPVKNATGVDSVESCRALLNARAAQWLEAAGVPVPRRPDGTPDCAIELSPRVFLDAEDVQTAGTSLEPPPAGGERSYP